jgi:formylglycine-generating enzyme required for sulfatase activity
MPGAGDLHPVVYVSCLEAMKFCEWLGSRERKKYRLPTEAEWEFAARGPDGRKYPWGNYAGRGDLANFADKNTVFAWSDREIDDGYPESSPVGAFPLGAGPFGMEDMAGNVWEWCLDYFESYRGTHKVNPRGPTSGAKRVYRGGSWKSRFNSLRATARGSNVPSYSCNDLGFRIVCECE